MILSIILKIVFNNFRNVFLHWFKWKKKKHSTSDLAVSLSLSLSFTWLTLWCIGWHGVLSWPNGFLHAVWFSHYQSVHIKLEYASAHCWTGHFKTHTHTHTQASTAEAKWERVFFGGLRASDWLRERCSHHPHYGWLRDGAWTAVLGDVINGLYHLSNGIEGESISGAARSELGGYRI